MIETCLWQTFSSRFYSLTKVLIHFTIFSVLVHSFLFRHHLIFTGTHSYRRTFLLLQPSISPLIVFPHRGLAFFWGPLGPTTYFGDVSGWNWHWVSHSQSGTRTEEIMGFWVLTLVREGGKGQGPLLVLCPSFEEQRTTALSFHVRLTQKPTKTTCSAHFQQSSQVGSIIYCYIWLV